MHLIARYIDELEIVASLTKLPILVAKAIVETTNEDKNNMVIPDTHGDIYIQKGGRNNKTI